MIPRFWRPFLVLGMLLAAGAGCASGVAVSLGVASDGGFPVTSNDPRALSGFDLNPPGTPGATAPPW